MDRQTLSIKKACALVGVTRCTIYKWIAAGNIEYVRTAGGAIRIFSDTLASQGCFSLAPGCGDLRATTLAHLLLGSERL